jgi:hypothetical protein
VKRRGGEEEHDKEDNEEEEEAAAARPILRTQKADFLYLVLIFPGSFFLRSFCVGVGHQIPSSVRFVRSLVSQPVCTLSICLSSCFLLFLLLFLPPPARKK